jgi:hypothetical protein
MAAAHDVQSPRPMMVINPVHHSEWIEIKKPLADSALSIPEAVDVPGARIQIVRLSTLQRGKESS